MRWSLLLGGLEVALALFVRRIFSPPICWDGWRGWSYAAPITGEGCLLESRAPQLSTRLKLRLPSRMA